MDINEHSDEDNEASMHTPLNLIITLAVNEASL